MFKSPASTRSVIEALESRIAPAAFTVTTTADSGPGSLRQAILDANALEGADTIGFDIPGDQLQLISLLSPLPTITGSVRISTLSSSGQVLEKVRLDGINAGPEAVGLRLFGTSGSVVAGLEIGNFSGTGVLIEAGTENLLQQNTIYSNGGHGVHLLGGSSNKIWKNTIGKSATITGSSGNNLDGVLVEGSRNTVFWVGETFSATASQPTNAIRGNGLFGIEIRGGGGGNTIEGLLVSENGRKASSLDQGGGIAIFDSPNNVGSYPRGNWILNNLGHGVLISDTSTGTISILSNTVSYNSGDGIHVVNTPSAIIGNDPQPSGNSIEGNGGWGIALINQSGGAKVSANTVLRNSAGGILVDSSSFSTIGAIAGNVGYKGNLIAYNSGAGITIKNSFAVTVTENSFTQSLPIDLGGDGPTPNDTSDADTGANGLLNYPAFTSTIRWDGATNVHGTFETDTPNRQFRLRFYGIDPADNRHELVYVMDVTTDSAGHAQVNLVFHSFLAPGKLIREVSVVATDLLTGNTSEFSPRVHVKSVVIADSLQVAEGNEGETTGAIVLKLNVADSVPITVRYQTIDGTAKAGDDFQAVQGTVTFAPGETTKVRPLTWFGDTIQETTEEFYFDFSDVQGGAIEGLGKATITLRNDDGIPVISSYGFTVVEGSSEAGTFKVVQFTVSLDKPSLEPVFVSLGLEGSANPFNSTPGNPQDYRLDTSSSFTFAPGETSYTGTITVFNDAVAEPRETISLKLGVQTGRATIGNEGVITILDDDLWQLRTSSIEITEGNNGQTLAAVTVNVDPLGLGLVREHPVTVRYFTVNERRPGEASPGSDYQTVEGTLTFAPGENSKTILVPIIGDITAEGSEFIEIGFDQLSGAVLVTPRAKITVIDDDSPQSLPVLSVSNASALEGDFGTSLLAFTFSLSKASTLPVSVQYGTGNGNGTATEGSDYTAVSGTLTFAPGETSKTISVPVLGDTLNEADETFRLLLSNATGASLANTEAMGFIINDDSGTSPVLPVLSIQGGSALEGHNGMQSLEFTVSLSSAAQWPVTVRYADFSGTASYPASEQDYLRTSGVLTFEPGETTKTVSVPILSDNQIEENETLFLRLDSPIGATLPASISLRQASGTIINDDFSPSEVGVVVSKNGRKALWTDGDGDLVTLTSSKGVLSRDNFQFGLDANGLVSLQKLFLNPPSGKAVAANVTFSVLQSGTGDGLVNVELIHSLGDLNKLSIPGRLGSLVAGDSKLKPPAIHKLVVDSFGLDPLAAEAGADPLVSSITGNIGHFVVKNDFLGAHLSVIDGGIRSLTVGGDILGMDPLHPVEIQASGAFHRIDVGGDVIHTDLIAGAAGAVAGSKGVRAGKVVVQGDWTASNLAVGAGAGFDGVFGTQDDIVLQGTPSSIARITIGGTISGTAESENSTDHFGFVAGRIAAFQVGGSKMPLTSKWNDSSEIGSTSDVMLRELAGRVRA